MAKPKTKPPDGDAAQPQQGAAEPMQGPIRVEYVALAALRRAPRNPKDHDLGAIHESIDRFGYTQPILIRDIDEGPYRGPYIVAGHGRVDTLIQKKRQRQPPPQRILERDGEWYVPVLRGIDFENDDEAEAYLIADNQTTMLGGWDVPALVDVLREHAELPKGLRGIGFDSDDLDRMVKEIANSSAGDGQGRERGAGGGEGGDAFLVVITCDNEKHQTDLLARFLEEGLNCRALVS